MNSGGTFHLTQRTKGGVVRSSRFEGVRPVAVFAHVEKACEVAEREHRRQLAERKLAMSEIQIRLVNWILMRETMPHIDPDAAPATLNEETRERIRVFMMREAGTETRYLDSAAYQRILEKGGFRIEPRFEVAGTFSGGVAAAKLRGLWGMIGKDGNWIIAPRFEDAMGAEAGFMPVKASGRWGIVNAHGRLTHKADHDKILSCRSERCPFQQYGRWGFLNVRGGTTAQPIYARINKFRDGYAAVQRNRLWFLIDTNGQEFGPYDVKRLFSPSEGLVLFVDHTNRRGFFSLDGRVAVGARYNWAGPFSGGLAAVWKSGKWGAINRSGQVVVPFRFENIGQFKDGLAPVQEEKAGSWGYINAVGRFAVRPRYSRGFNFRDGIAIVRVPHPRKTNVTEPDELLRGYIDKHGRWVYSPSFEDVYAFSEGLAPVKIFGRWGYLDLSLIRRRDR